MKEERLFELSNLAFKSSLIDGKTSYKTEFMIMVIKSLLPSLDSLDLRVDYERFDHEVNFWKYYSFTNNQSLKNIFRTDGEELYWTEWDDSLYYRLYPIIFANIEVEGAKKEILRNFLYTMGNPLYLLEAYAISLIIFYMKEGDYKRESIEDLVKKDLINLSQVDFMRDFKSFYSYPLASYKGNYTVDFEMAKISAINNLNGIYDSKMPSLEKVFRLVLEEADLEHIIIDLGDTPITEGEEDNFSGFSNYVVNLRKGRIDPEKLRVDSYLLPDLFSYNAGDRVYHSLLNQVEILDKKENKGALFLKVRAKSGIYILKKPIHG